MMWLLLGGLALVLWLRWYLKPDPERDARDLDALVHRWLAKEAELRLVPKSRWATGDRFLMWVLEEHLQRHYGAHDAGQLRAQSSGAEANEELFQLGLPEDGELFDTNLEVRLLTWRCLDQHLAPTPPVGSRSSAVPGVAPEGFRVRSISEDL